MSDYYNHDLHKEYEHKINKEINIKDVIFKALELHIKLIQDNTNYPNDQITLYELSFPFSNQRHVPELTLSDYVMCLNNYRTNGNLFTVRYLHPIIKYIEVLFLNSNENGDLYLFVISPNFNSIEQVKKNSNIALTTDTIEGIYY
jgi:hypothetical protein